jgi:serine/threonine protein kinase
MNTLKTADMIVLYSSRTKIWKITDFGLTTEGTSRRIFDWKCVSVSSAISGTAEYRAPEILSEHPMYSVKTDIWALGCIMYELAFSKSAFRNHFAVRDYVLDGMPISMPLTAEFGESFKQSTSNFIHRMLSADPRSRPSAKQLRKSFEELGRKGKTPMDFGSQGSSPSYNQANRPTEDQKIWLLVRPWNAVISSATTGNYPLYHWAVLITSYSSERIQGMLRAGETVDGDEALGTISELNCQHCVKEGFPFRRIIVSTFRREWSLFSAQYVGTTAMTNDDIQAKGRSLSLIV